MAALKSEFVTFLNFSQAFLSSSRLPIGIGVDDSEVLPPPDVAAVALSIVMLCDVDDTSLCASSQSSSLVSRSLVEVRIEGVALLGRAGVIAESESL